ERMFGQARVLESQSAIDASRVSYSNFFVDIGVGESAAATYQATITRRMIHLVSELVAVRDPEIDSEPLSERAPKAGAAKGPSASAFLPPYARRSKSLEVLIPILYLKGDKPPLSGPGGMLV